MLAGGATFAVRGLVHRSDTARQAQLVIAAIGSEANGALAIPWDVQNGRSVPEVARTLADAHGVILANLDKLERLDDSRRQVLEIRALDRDYFRTLKKLTPLAAKGTAGAAEANTYYQSVQERLLSLAGDLLFVAQDDAGQFELVLAPLQPRELVEQAVASARPAADARQIRLSLQLEDIPDISADRARLSQLIDNLLSNSLKFTPAGGRVDVRLSRDPDGSTVFEFQDNGIGISKPEQERLFKRFFRTEAATNNVIAGTGLGLSIVRAIAGAHGGSVSSRAMKAKGRPSASSSQPQQTHSQPPRSCRRRSPVGSPHQGCSESVLI